MIEVISRLSAEVVAKLDEAGWPALRAFPNGETGRIALIDAHRIDQFMPPRITMIPIGTKVGPKDPTRGTVRVANNLTSYDAASKAVINNPPIATKEVTFEVRCWGIASDTEDDPYGRDFEYTEALHDAFVTVCDEIMSGCYRIGDGRWETVSHVKRVGRELVFTVTILMPITRRLSSPTEARPLPNAPSDVEMVATDAMVIGSGASSPGCEE